MVAGKLKIWKFIEIACEYTEQWNLYVTTGSDYILLVI